MHMHMHMHGVHVALSCAWDGQTLRTEKPRGATAPAIDSDLLGFEAVKLRILRA